ncbi:MAG: transcriptional repressor NrdR [Rhodospirillales bacterium]|nr:transcriptional repressor NrdR [Rhodospirillales bacterium]MCB9972994.1 transcriptional repressor NrdR [Rhodospirillales bacterium]MCB9980018.1 transcriptional repressor NrdR [Rhodospirillales bacterium]
MRCPFCGHEDSQVKDSRPADDGASIRRRRACIECGARFTTFERIQLRDLVVLKSDGRAEAFDREKIIKAMHIALRKRPVADQKIEQAANSIVRQLETLGDNEISSSKIGELVMKALTQLDVIGYIRFASVYKNFREPDDFNDFLEEIERLQVKNKEGIE